MGCKGLTVGSFAATSGDGGPSLRKKLEKPLQHIRVCTVPLEEFCRIILPTKVLTDAETVQVCLYHGNKDIKPDLKEVCNITEPRIRPYEKSELIKLTLPNLESYSEHTLSTVINISIKQRRLELTSLVLPQYSNNTNNITIRIEQTNITTEPQTVTTIVRPNQRANSNGEFVVSVSGESEDEAVHLLPDSKYMITITASQGLGLWCDPYSNIYSGTDFDVLYNTDSSGYHRICVEGINYKTLTEK